MVRDPGSKAVRVGAAARRADKTGSDEAHARLTVSRKRQHDSLAQVTMPILDSKSSLGTRTLGPALGAA